MNSANPQVQGYASRDRYERVEHGELSSRYASYGVRGLVTAFYSHRDKFVTESESSDKSKHSRERPHHTESVMALTRRTRTACLNLAAVEVARLD